MKTRSMVWMLQLLIICIVSTLIALTTPFQVDLESNGDVSIIKENPKCVDWANLGECHLNPKFMLKHCLIACKRKVMSPTLTDTQSLLSSMESTLNKKMEYLLSDTFTDECRQQVGDAMLEHLVKYIGEEPPPFQNYHFTSQCPPKKKKKTNKTITSPNNIDDISICYLLLIHDNAEQAKRLISALQESMHTFIIHVDGKASNTLFEEMSSYAAFHTNVWMLPERVNISWGGHNMVKATLNGMIEALKLKIDFDWLCNLSGASYPLVRNELIRAKLFTFAEKTMMEVNPRPSEPSEESWHYYVECDNKLRRIAPLKPPRGISMYTGSQWFFASKPFVEWLVHDKSLAARYAEYSAHTVVADENYFATMLKNSPFCHDHENSNMLHVQFDQWEHDKRTHKKGLVNRDKCLMPNPDHCGRSPTVITVESLPVLELSDMLWARKFDSNIDDTILDALDIVRQEGHQKGAHFAKVRAKLWSDCGEELCMVIGGHHGDAVSMQTCNGTEEELIKIGTCSSDGTISLHSHSPFMNISKGRFSRPFCPIQSVSNQNCLDLEGESVEPGTKLIGWPCSKKWNQLFSFGDGELVGSIFLNVPLVMYQDKRMCLEALERSPGSGVTVRDCDPLVSTQKFMFDIVSNDE